MSMKYTFHITYNEDTSTFTIPSSSPLSKLKTIIESLFDNLKSTPYELIYSKSNLLSFQHSLPLTSIFSSLSSSPNGQPFSSSSQIPLTILTSSQPSSSTLSSLIISLNIIFNKTTFQLDNIPASLPFEKLKFKLLAMCPEIDQEDHQIMYNNIDIANIHNNKKPLYKVLNITQHHSTKVNDAFTFTLTIKSHPKRLIKSLKKCSYCHVIKADYICTKCAIATCSGCAYKEKHNTTKDINYVDIDIYRNYEQKYLDELLVKLKGIVNENNALQSDNFIALMKDEKLNILAQRFEEVITMLNVIYKEQYDNLKMILDNINELYHPMELSKDLNDLINEILQYKDDTYFDCEEAMRKVLSFKLRFDALCERFKKYVKELNEFKVKYKKCLDIIAKIRKCLEEQLHETRMLFGSDELQRKRYNSLMRVYDSEHVLVFDNNNEKFQLIEIIDDEFMFKNCFGNFIQTNVMCKNTQKMFVITGIPCQMMFVFDLFTKEMSFVGALKYNHNWWPGLIAIQRNVIGGEDDVVVFCLSGSYTTKCEMMVFGKGKEIKKEKGENGGVGGVPIVENMLNVKDSIGEGEQQEQEQQIDNQQQQVNNEQQQQQQQNDLSQYRYKWLEIPSTEVPHGQGGTFILNNKYIYLIYGYDASQRPISQIERLNIESIPSLPLITNPEPSIKWETLQFENPDNISSYLYYNSLLKTSDTDIYILGGLIESDKIDVVYRLDCTSNKILKTDTKLNFHSVKFNYEKNFLLLNRDTSLLSKNTKREYGIIDGKNKVHIIKESVFEHKTFIYNP